MATVIEQCSISPSSDAAREFSLPLLFFDMFMYGLPALQCVWFFEFPPASSKSHFMEAIVPHLKRSLSQTLDHFLPLAGNIIISHDKPIIRYVAGDSISFTVSEAVNADDFVHLSGNAPRACDEFYEFVPHSFPRATYNSEYGTIACPVLALQATVFAGRGICIGVVAHHVVADASSLLSFMQAWSRSTSIIDDQDICRLRPPFYDRESVVNINGLDSIYWELMSHKSVEPPPVKFPIDKSRATFVLRKEQIQRLKESVLAKRTGKKMRDMSSFTIACALVWICSAKSAEAEDDDEVEYFIFSAECRGRLIPPLPANYFGNCEAHVMAELKHGELVRGDGHGFARAAEAIGKAISDRVNGKKGVLHGAERWPEELEELLKNRRVYGVAGSPRFDVYSLDYGWGKAKKFELVSNDAGSFISLSKSREFAGGLEIGISKPKLEMEAFTTVFNQLLADLQLRSRL